VPGDGNEGKATSNRYQAKQSEEKREMDENTARQIMSSLTSQSALAFSFAISSSAFPFSSAWSRD